MNNFSFCKFHFPNNIRKIIWEITNQCNYSCEYCIFSSTGKKPRGELSFEQCIQTIEQLKQEGFNYIKFTGGEPFMRDDFLDILSYAQSQGFSFDISSNASFITDEISQKLSFLNINFIHISLDGYDSFSQEIVRGKKSFSKTVNGLQSLIKYNSNIRLGCVIHLYNQDKLQEIVNFANQYKIKEVIFSIMSPLGKMAKNSPLLTNKSVSQLIHTIESLHSEFTVINHNLLSDVQPITFNLSNSQSCPGGDKFLFIDSIGNVSPCTWISDKFPQFHIHSLHDYSLKKILNSNLFLKFHYEKNNLKGKCFAFEYKDNNKFRKIYSFATENISFIDKIILNNNNNNKALTITGSGDQALMLSYYGFQSITCIDSNYLAKYYTELKIAAIKQLSFIDFTNFFKNNINSFSYNIFKKISSELSINCEKFWNLQYIKHNHNGYNIRNSEIFNLLNDSWEQKINNVPYLNQQKIYETIQNNIKKTEFIFVIDEFQNYEFNETYDLILLSNIADYSHYIFKDDYLEKFKQFFVQKGYNLLNSNGSIMFAYIYDFENKGQSYLRNKINLPIVRKKYFNSFNYQECKVPSAISLFKNDVACFIFKN